HEILHKTYSGLAKAEQFVPCGSLGETIRSRFRAIAYRFYGSVHRKLYQKYSLAAGDAYSAHFTQSESGAPPLDQFIQYFNAFERYPRRAIIYLHRARDFETAIIPAAEASYNLEEGILLNNKSLIAKALDAFDPVWERDMISYGCRELALAEELFALNRGALLQAGIGLPVEITIHSAGGRKRALYQAPVLLKQALAKAGFVRSKHGTARFKLDIHINELPAAVSCELIDTEGEVKPLRKAIPLRSLSKTDIYRFAGALRNAVFRVE
ncbi:MAG: hypothetical protein FWD36_10235, partial [Treponema sp.]|nr:hypothetical protein [Treponema sp.]